MGDWWTPPMMPDPSHDTKELSSISHISMSPSRHSSSTALPKHSYSVLSAFCTEDNVQQCVTYINQEASSLGLSGISLDSGGPGVSLSAVSALNLLYELLQLNRRNQRHLQELENQQLKNCSNLEHLQTNNSRLKDQLEHTRRENSGLHEGERQLQLKIRTLQSCLKSEKEEVQKLQNIIASRATQYTHDAKRKERESAKLKERLNQLLVDKRDRKLAIEMVNCVSRSDGKRGLWKTGKMEARHEGEMYKALLSDYEARQQTLMQENSELKKLLQHMKKDMVSILSPKKPCSKAPPTDDSCTKAPPTDDSLEQAGSEAEDEGDECSRDALEQACGAAREQLANSIRLQWRRLKNHMQRLDSQVSLAASQEETISIREHEEAMQRMRVELQQCKEFIQAQQQLLQQQLSSPFDDDTAALLNDGYTLEEKERLKEEWRLFHEQKRNFERERKSFTEAAIRLGHERKAFEEDRAQWLKTQFLNMTPFVDRKRPAMTESRSALSINAEPEAKVLSTPAAPNTSITHPGFTSNTPSPAHLPSTAELYRTLQLFPDTRNPGRRGSNGFQSGDTLTKSRLRNSSTDCSIFSLLRDENSAA
ncbi:synovial sarcoma, X breakpoint 2 interacting protein a isoform X1 [Colossoma macropomum]|uniref:synovial sarcoma, X breakpoint 2 interacting protein a isoform X1 n=1 Tax=Colossoma macropomum TaxID=42526 RepID=UPI001863A5A4|nr:synovial sarcoma, X breakpoint 2 interacting protein a isoform X1 [Colossoma macropomum]XP_036453144.1 synovial sarcoma, X breakpoint 2 interacting protein a isoform X1 [Colossoma macropomum]XP_036453145.1 synovial sarcoma, X breakpoint 2 interacting protein a isoform X1 [Colossoma macropomum]XP_036453146.1 synovial sarcoma, X breakpoint 2 interacting protein a isoform X1 [Colossoma macropomum]